VTLRGPPLDRDRASAAEPRSSSGPPGGPGQPPALAPRPTPGATAPPAERRVPFLGRVVDVREGEGGGLARGFVYFFTLLYGYYLIRPIREEMGIRGGVTKLHWLFTATFVVMLVAVPLYSALVARVPRRRAVPWVYRFFVLNLLAYWALARADVAAVWMARAFYVWVSVYNLFVVSVFWSLLADVFTPGQGKRLFGFVSAGGTAGALLGSATVTWLSVHLSIGTLVLLSAASLEIAAQCASGLSRWAQRAPAPGVEAAARREAGALGGSAWSGFSAVVRSRYLLGVALQIVLFSVGSTFLYLNLVRTVGAVFPDTASRLALFAKVDLAVNVLALATGSLGTGRFIAATGLGAALAAVPALTAVGYGIAALSPGVWTLGAFQTLRRGLHFAVDRPAREVLFTVVPREDKYKAKSFVDTFVYRGSDAMSSSMHAGLAALGLAIPALSVAAIPFAVASFALALWLARRERRLEEERR
jgi:AAA family ATP:ADP antiporter